MGLRSHWTKPNLAFSGNQHSVNHHAQPQGFTHGDPRSERMKKALNSKAHPATQPHPLKNTGKISHKQPVRVSLPRFRVQ